MKTKPWAIALMFVTTLLTASAQLLWKFGANTIVFWLAAILLNWGIILGFATYGVASVLLIVSLKGGELSVLYPMVALSFIWVNIFSPIFFGETMNAFKWAGVSVIIVGIILVNVGGNHD